jgi:site-specific DNA recombinase
MKVTMDNSQPMRYAIYARYSSDLQRQSSIEDQIRKCNEYGKAQGWVGVQDCIYTDEATSGVSAQRPGLQRMLSAALSPHRPFDVILIDDTSRISRSLSDAVQLFEKLRFAGLRVIAVAQGVDTQSEQADVLVTVHGLVDSLYVKELSKKTHRGLEGAFLRGFHAGGRCFGYRNVPADGGGVRLEIEESEAAVVRRIFEMSANGLSLKSIATALNADRVCPPRPRSTTKHATWAPTAIREMLRRELYAGRLIWNRSRFIKVPGTNKRVARPRPRSEWRTSERPDLRIVSDVLWQAVQGRQEKMQQLYGGHPGLLNRSASSGNLLTGFVKCGLCGGNLVIVTGRKRRHAMYGCPQHWYRGACTNGLKIRQTELESGLLNELQIALLKPAAISHILDEFKRHLKSEQADHSVSSHRIEERKKGLTAELARLTAAIAGSGHSPTLLAAIAEREKELDAISTLRRGTNPIFESNSKRLRQYVVERLSSLPELLSCDVPLARTELSKHVTQITMHPSQQSGNRHYVCQGEWNLLGDLPAPGHVRMVAGGGFEPPTFGL